MSLVMAGRRPTSGEAATAMPSSRTLWAAEDFIRLVLALGVGGIVVGVAWYICSGDASFNQQIGPLDAAVGGLIFAGGGNVMWLLRGRRALGERRRALMPDPEAAILVVVPDRQVSTAGLADPSDLLLAGDGLVRFHRATCPLASGRSWTPMTRGEHEGLGRQPCGVCKP
jgi:hypothetical protein